MSNSSSHLWASFPIYLTNLAPVTTWVSGPHQLDSEVIPKRTGLTVPWTPRAEHMTCSESWEAAPQMERSHFRKLGEWHLCLISPWTKRARGGIPKGQWQGLSWELATVLLNPRNISRFPNLFSGHKSSHHRYPHLTWFKQLWVSSGVWTRNSIPSLNKDTLFFPESLSNLSASQEEGIPTSPWQRWGMPEDVDSSQG